MASVRAACVGFAGALLVIAAAAGAEHWPNRAIRVVSPFAPGSAADTVSRVVLDQVAQQLAQPVVIETRPGAGGTLGFASVAKADPDGYTLVVSSSSMSSEVVLHRTLPYDPVRDFAPVVLFGSQPNVLVASPQSGFKTVADLVAAARAKPGVLTFASAGIGSASHMAAEKFRLAAKIDVRHIPFRDGGLTEVMAGRIDYYFIPFAAAAAMIASGKVTVLAVSTPKRVAVMPEVPSIAEAGYPDAEYLFWNGLSAPAQTPRSIIDTLHDATENALQVAVVRERLAKLGVEPQQMSVAQYAQFVRDDLAATVQLAKDAHIEPTD